MSTSAGPFFEQHRKFQEVEPCIRGQCDDPVKQLEYKEFLMRKKWIQLEDNRLLKEKIALCYAKAGVNYQIQCAELIREFGRRMEEKLL